MDNKYTQIISDFLSETETYIDQLDTLSFETAAELYDLFDDATHTAINHINEINTDLRVMLCDRQDKILDRIADTMPSFQHSGEPLGIYSPAIGVMNRWENVHIMKDVGLVGYNLANVLGAEPVMYYGTKQSDYPYLHELPKLKMLYHESDDDLNDAYINQMINDHSKMDILLVYGRYDRTLDYLDYYRKYRPDGKVYCALDMNSFWYGKIDWDNDPSKKFATQCNVFATSCRYIRDLINADPKVRFPCHWLPNGFYKKNYVQTDIKPENKENIILTVGRIGTREKNNMELMIAFAMVSEVLDGWSLRLVGPVEPDFQPYIDHFFEQCPDLKERIIFTGAINNKVDLYNEYKRAKIFAMTSLSEGFPNVYAEALFHGCMFVTSDIDGADDMTNFGELGQVYKRDDTKGLAQALVNVCSNADKSAFKKHIPKALAYANRYYDWNRNAKKLAYMLFK